jgi:cytochrome bd-type quinol oxidase subunit 2
MITWLLAETILYSALSFTNMILLVLAVILLYRKIAKISNENLSPSKKIMVLHVVLLLALNITTALSLSNNVSMYSMRN